MVAGLVLMMHGPHVVIWPWPASSTRLCTPYLQAMIKPRLEESTGCMATDLE